MTDYSVPFYDGPTEVFIIDGVNLGTDDELDVGSGGTAIGTTVTSAGSDFYSEGGIYVSSGGVEIGTTDNAGSFDDVNSGGLASQTTINLDGAQYVESGGTTVSVTINDLGYLAISGGGVAIATQVNSGGAADVAGGTAQNTTLSSGGLELVESGGTSINATVLAGGVQVLFSDVGSNVITSAGAPYATIVESGGTLTETLAEGAVIVEIQSGGEIYATGTAGGLTDSSTEDGDITVGGSATGAVISSGGSIVFDGGVASGITVASGGTEIVGGAFQLDGLTETPTSRSVDATSVGAGVLEIVESTDVASDTVISSGGTQILSGGSSVNASVSAGGLLTISAGGVASGSVISGGGSEYISSGGTDIVTGADAPTGLLGSRSLVVASGGSEIVRAGGVATAAILQGGKQSVSLGGSATSTLVSSGGSQGVYSGGTATFTTVLSGAAFFYLGGTVDALTVSSGGSVVVGGGSGVASVSETGLAAAAGSFVYVLSGGTAIQTRVAGFEGVQAGGIESGASVFSSGTLKLTSGGTAIGATVSYGGTELVVGSLDRGAEISGGQLLISGGTGIGDQVENLGAQLAVSGGVASASIVHSGGTVYISAGGAGQGIEAFDPAATIEVDSGGTTVGTVLSGDSSIEEGPSELVLSGGTSIGANVGSGGYYQIGEYSGGVVPGGTSISATVLFGGEAYDYQGGIALDPTISGGDLELGLSSATSGAVSIGDLAGGVAVSALVTAGGSLEVVEGGTALKTTLSSTAPYGPNNSTYFTVADGGVSISASVGVNTVEYIGSGGTGESGSVLGKELLAGGTSLGDTVLSGGTVEATSGSEIDAFTVSSGGALFAVQGRYVASGGIIMSGASAYLVSAVVGAFQNNGVVIVSGGVVDLSGGVTGSGNIDVASGADLVIGAPSTVDNLTVSSGGTAQVDGSTLTTDPVTVDSGGTIMGDGTITGEFTEDGVVVASGGTLDITGDVTGPADFIIDGGATLEFDGPVASSVDITFATGAPGTLALSDPSAMSGTISNEGPGDTVEEVAPPSLCFLEGTRILTSKGEVPVESLEIGDLVMTRFGALQPIRWIGRQSYDRRFIRGNPTQTPVRIRKGALGEHHPCRDLHVSPGHALLVGDQLILAKFLTNGVTITQDEAPEIVRYHHIELLAHDCVAAEGVWSETFADGDELRSAYQNAAEFWRLYPDHPRRSGFDLCAPRPLEGPQLEGALRSVLARLPSTFRPGPLRGYVDQASAASGVITGWAQDLDHPDTPVDLEIVYEDRVIGSALACTFREDLEAAKIGRGRCAFRFTAPIGLQAYRLHTLQVRRKADGVVIPPTEACANNLEDSPLPTQEVA